LYSAAGLGIAAVSSSIEESGLYLWPILRSPLPLLKVVDLRLDWSSCVEVKSEDKCSGTSAVFSVVLALRRLPFSPLWLLFC